MVPPVVPPALPPQPPATVTVAQPATGGHVVRPGETLWGIAQAHRTTPEAIVTQNHLVPGAHIRPGQRLRLPQPAAAPRRGPGERRDGPTRVYVVRVGDTLEGIARRHGMGLPRLVHLNGLDPRAHIHPGDRLRVHGRAPQQQRRPRTVPDRADSFAGRTYPAEVVAAAERNRAALAQRPVPTRTEVRELVVATARRHGVDPRLALAISYQESGWDQRQVSVANAVGTMQVIPSSGRWASSLVGRELDLRRTEDNITAGVVILGQLTRLADSPEEAIAGYYQGLASVRANGMYPDTRGYVASVQALQRRM